MPLDISVAICTYNHAGLLSDVLDSVCRQTLTPDRYEILVVDNASTDNTADVIREFQEKYPTHLLRWVYETRQGLGYARNKALKEAKGDYIAYLDDDSRAKSDWLALASEHLTGSNFLHCLGGPIFPFYTNEKPSWFKDQYETRTWGEQERCLEPGESFSGSNMIWRKETIQSIGGFGETVGIRGRDLSVGEETIAFRHMWEVDQTAVVIYNPALIVFHWVPLFKMKVSYFIKRAFVIGQVAIKIDNRNDLRWRVSTLLRSGGQIVLRAAKAVVRIPSYSHWQNWAVEECFPIVSKLGTCLAVCGIFIKIQQK